MGVPKLKENKKLTVQRSELKYLIGLDDRLKLLKMLDTLLIPDTYGGYAGYSVRSIYFDGVDDQDYYGKVAKKSFQKRIRLRIYSTNDKTAKFEIKRKWSKNQVKDSLIVSKEDAIEILKGNFEVLKNYTGDTAEYGYEICTTMKYRPVSMVEYKRRAYTHPQFQTRITLDSDLKYTIFDDGLFDSSRKNTVNVTNLSETILEVKYEKFLMPYIQDALKKLELKSCPISKFGSSRSILDMVNSY